MNGSSGREVEKAISFKSAIRLRLIFLIFSGVLLAWTVFFGEPNSFRIIGALCVCISAGLFLNNKLKEAKTFIDSVKE